MSIVRSTEDRQVQNEWRGLIAIYLFLGGVGGGAYAVAATGSILGDTWANVTEAGLWLSFPVVIVGMLFLLAHLGSPMRAPLAMSKLGSSWISRGVWILSIFILLSVIHFGLVMSGGVDTEIPLALPIVGMLFAVFTMLYTGALLSGSKGYPFWMTGMLPVLFMVSGLVTGLFATILGMVGIDMAAITATQIRMMSGVAGGLIFMELLVLFFFLHASYRTPNTRESAKRMLSKGSFIFGDLIMGLFIPLILCFAVYFGIEDLGTSLNVMIAASVLGLIGGFLLRNAVLGAGMAISLDMAGFHFRPVASLDFEHSPMGRMPPQK